MQQALLDYAQYLQERSLSLRSAVDYPKEALNYLHWLVVDGLKQLNEITHSHVQSYWRDLSTRQYREKPLSASTVRKRLEMVKAFLSWCYEQGILWRNPAQGLALPQKSRTLPRNIPKPWEMKALLDSVDVSTALGRRDKAILELMYSTGLRNAELRALRLSDLHLKSATLYVVGKGSKAAMLPIGASALKALSDYLLFARDKLLAGKGHGGPRFLGGASWERDHKQVGSDLIFLSVNGHKLSSGNLGDMITRYAKKAGLEYQLKPHGIRHACATHLLLNGADVRLIQKLLRHSSLDTTQIYTHLNVDDLAQAQRLYHPREMSQRDQAAKEENAGDGGLVNDE